MMKTVKRYSGTSEEHLHSEYMTFKTRKQRRIFTMNKLMDWMKGKFMKYHISDKEYDMIQKDMQEENRNIAGKCYP